jgi:hypothetical protein
MRRLQPREIVRRVHVDLSFGERQQLNFLEMLIRVEAPAARITAPTPVI